MIIINVCVNQKKKWKKIVPPPPHTMRQLTILSNIVMEGRINYVNYIYEVELNKFNGFVYTPESWSFSRAQPHIATPSLKWLPQ